MATLTSLIPDATVLIALTQEELAGVLLQLAKLHRQNGLIQLQTITSCIHGGQGFVEGYPQERHKEAEIAVAEAWNWLIVQGLLIRDPGVNGNNGFMLLSRRAESVLAEGSFKDYSRSVSFPKTLIHSSIAEEVWIDLARGDYGTAVFKAFRAVEIAVRAAGGYPDTEFGTQLMRKAFDKHVGPLADKAQPEPEREALAHLFAGAIGSYKNSHSHRSVVINDASEAQEMVLLASHLLRIVDSRRSQS